MNTFIKKYKYILVALTLLLFGIFDTINMYKIPSIFADLSSTFGLDSTQTAWLVSAYSMTAFIMAIPTGFLNDKFGPKKIILCGVSVSAAGALLGMVSFSLFSGSITLLLISRIMEGLCYIFSGVCMPVLINQITKKPHIGAVMGIWAIRTNLACIIGATFTPILVHNTGFSVTWLIYLICMLAATCLMVKISKNNSQKKLQNSSNQKTNEKPAKQNAKKPNLSSEIKELKTTINQHKKPKNPSSPISIACFYVSFLIISIIQASVINFTPILLQTNANIDAATSGLISSLPMLISIGSCLLFGHLCDKRGSFKPSYVFGIALMGPGAFLMNFGIPFFIIGIILLGIGLGAPAVTACGVFEMVHPKNHGLAIGAGMAVFSLGQVIGTDFTSRILGTNFQNYTICAIIMLCLGILGTAIALSMRVKTKAENRTTI